MKSIILIYKQRNLLYYLKKSIKEKIPYYLLFNTSIILDFSKLKAWIYIFPLI